MHDNFSQSSNAEIVGFSPMGAVTQTRASTQPTGGNIVDGN